MLCSSRLFSPIVPACLRSSGQAEPLEVHLPVGNLQPSQGAEDGRGHRGRAADVHVAFGHVGYQGSETVRLERRGSLSRVTGEQVQLPLPVPAVRKSSSTITKLTMTNVHSTHRAATTGATVRCRTWEILASTASLLSI
jgi:hypothetical protein